MKIQRKNINAFDFDGLEIRDYTAGLNTRSSLAEITVPPGVKHKRAWSRRSDKYYYCVEGSLIFEINHQVVKLAEGDVCFILKGARFKYENNSDVPARLLLVHTPSFDLDEEVFEE